MKGEKRKAWESVMQRLSEKEMDRETGLQLCSPVLFNLPGVRSHLLAY